MWAVALILVNCNSDATLGINALFGAVLEIEIVKLVFKAFVRRFYLIYFFFHAFIEVYASFLAPFEWMGTVFAI